MQSEPILGAVIRNLLGKPNFSTVFSESMKNVEINESFLESFCNGLQLSLLEKIAISLALSDSENPDARLCGKNFCMAQIEELCANPGSLSCHDQIQNIIIFLKQSEGLSKHVDSFMQILSLVQFKDTPPFVLTPLLPDEMHEVDILRWNMELFHDCEENDFDAILADIQKEMNMGDIVKELGYGCMVDVSQCKEILSLFLPLTDNMLSKLLGAIASTHAGLEDNQSTFLTFGAALGYNNLSELPPLNTWNIDVLIDTVKQLAPQTNWIRVIENLDHEGFFLPSEEAFSFLMSVYKHACKEPFPLHAICGSVWKNTEGQLSFLKYAVSAPPEMFTFAHSVRQLAFVDAINGHKLQNGHANHAWLCLELLDVLCQLAEKGHASIVRSILDYPLKHCPEVLLLGMAHINTTYNLLQREVSLIVFPMIVKSSVGSGMILHLWHVNPNLVMRGFMDSLNSDVDSITRIVDICQELKILSSVVEIIPSYYSIRLAAVASRKEFLDLVKWLSNNLTTYKDVFFEECLKFLKEVHFGGSQNLSGQSFHQSGAVLNVYTETTATFLKVLKSHTDLVTSRLLSEELEKLHISIIDSNPRLQNGGAADSSTSDGYADDIEAEANSYFHQMFSDQLTINAMVQMLARFKESSVKREKSIFECMIANLFEEYRFFPKYPERQLKIAAVLFGSVIKHQLVTHLSLGIALRYVLDALRKPADSKALARISSGHTDVDGVSHASVISNHNSAQASLGHVEQLGGSSVIHPGQPHLPMQLQQRRENPLDDRHKASGGSSADVKPLLSSLGQSSVVTPADTSSSNKLHTTVSASSMLSSSPGFVRPSRGATSTRFGSALNIETLVAAAEKRETPIEAPGSEVQDKISFIINNISSANFEAKAKEFTEILKEQYYPWFAQYMVMKRGELLEEVQMEEVLYSTLFMCMYSESFSFLYFLASIEPNFHDLYLKFLDKVNSKALNKEIVQATYENCKVLLGSELIKSSSEERSLLKNLGSWLGKLTIGRNQAYEKGLMIAVIPFTSKVLEPCQSSLAYQPPNPWTMGILGLLAEIYSMPNLKMNLKFDIEVLFKNLAQIISDLKSGLVPPVNQVELPLEVTNPSNTGAHPHMLSQYAGPLHISTGALMEDEKVTPLACLINFPLLKDCYKPLLPNHLFLLARLELKTCFPSFSDHMRSLMYTILEAQWFWLANAFSEDYAMESDETRILNAAHLMVASLAGSLAHVTCKAATDKVSSTRWVFPVAIVICDSIGSIDAEINKQLSLRRKHREGMGSTFFDTNLYTQGSMGGVPEPLRPKPGQLSLSQQRVYEDFVRLPWQNQSSQSSHSMSAGVSVQSGNTGLNGTNGSVSGQINPGAVERLGSSFLEPTLSTRDALDKYQIVAQKLEALVNNDSQGSRNTGGSFLRFLISILRCVSRDEAALAVAQKVFKGLYDNASNNIHVCAHLAILTAIRDVCKLLSRSLLAGTMFIWQNLLTGEGTRLLLSSLSLSFKPSVVEEPKVISELHNLVDALAKVVFANLATKPGYPESLPQLVEMIKNPAANTAALSASNAGKEDKARQSRDNKGPGLLAANREELNSVDSVEPDPAGFREQVSFTPAVAEVSMLFTEWYRICELPGANDTASTHFTLQLHQNGLLKGDDATDRFFRLLMELAVSHCLSTEVINSGALQSPQQLPAMSFLAIDIYSKLVFYILKGSSKLFLLSKILAVTVRFILKEAEEKKASFNPRPFFRLFINWLLDLGSLEPVTDGANLQILTAFANAFHALQPLKFLHSG
ncbi:CCR4-NOT transcription complex subunit 1, CAF1-binding domain [Sesbania bispinosa]|nr:CCR4-NOT transcription complex subunit 1, CAF1-binding domain [Sesbania bispinosa]